MLLAISSNMARKCACVMNGRRAEPAIAVPDSKNVRNLLAAKEKNCGAGKNIRGENALLRRRAG